MLAERSYSICRGSTSHQINKNKSQTSSHQHHVTSSPTRLQMDFWSTAGAPPHARLRRRAQRHRSGGGWRWGAQVRADALWLAHGGTSRWPDTGAEKKLDFFWVQIFLGPLITKVWLMNWQKLQKNTGFVTVFFGSWSWRIEFESSNWELLGNFVRLNQPGAFGSAELIPWEGKSIARNGEHP